MRKILTFLFVINIAIGAGAQVYKTISGQVVDRSTQEPLPFTTVYLHGKSIGTVANENGEFELNISTEHQNDSLTVSHIGYESYYGLVKIMSHDMSIELKEAIVDLDVVSVEAKKLTANEIFAKVISKIEDQNGYPDFDFRMDGFYREVHASEEERTGVLECALEVYSDDVTRDFKDIVFTQFRKVYNRQKNTDQFIQAKEGHNHLLLLLNDGINLVPLAKQVNRTIWKLPLEVERITYYNDRLVYVLVNKVPGRLLRLFVDVEDYSVYKNELIMEVEPEDHERYAWQKVNSKGEKCGAILDHQSYEYREINGKLFPYYSFRRFDFRCYDLKEERLSANSSFSTELLINNVEPGISPDAADRFKRKQGLINRNEPYDSAFWQYFNDIKDVTISDRLSDETISIENQSSGYIGKTRPAYPNRSLKIGDHSALEFTRADTLFGAPSPSLSCYDVRHYDLSIRVDPEREWIDGLSQIAFEMVDSSDRIRVDLFEYLEITKILFEDQELDFQRDLDAVYLQFPKTLYPEALYAIQISYEGHPLDPDFDLWASGFLWDQDVEGQPFLQSLCQGYGPKAWWPVKNHLSDEPDSASVHITLPDTLFGVSNGTMVGKSSENNETTYHWKVRNPINNYGIAVHIGHYKSLKTTLNNMPLSYYFLAGDSLLARENLQIVPDMLKIYERYFGPYPFREDGFKIVQSPYPMEHQSSVAVGKYFDDQLILHESAHEWWGNSVSIRDNADIWINEAFATYAESLYIEATLGYELGQEYLNARKSEIHNDHPLVGVRNVNHFHYRIEDKYFKGALMLNTLRHLVDDDELWFGTIKGIAQEFRHSFIDTPTLLKYLNDKLGQDYSAFFQQYLYATEIPILIVDKNAMDRYKWKNIGEDFTMNIVIDERSGIRPTRVWQSAGLDLSALIDEIESRYLVKVVLE